MIDVAPLIDSTPLIGKPEALRARWEEDGVLFLRGVMDEDLIAWAREKYRGALAAEDLIDPAQEVPAWTGKQPKTRRPIDALGTPVWHEIVKQPELNAILRDVFDADPVWIPIAAHRNGMPSGPVIEGQDLFAGRHQDGFFNEGIQFAICWMPIRDVDMRSGSFAVAPGTHSRGVLHVESDDGYDIPAGVIADNAWRAADYRVGDVLIFNYLTAHATLPNPSNEIRMSLDVRAIPAWAPQPVIGAVEKVEGGDVTIRTDAGDLRTVHVDDDTFIRDMNPRPRVPTSELERIAFPGAHVMAMAREDGRATVLRRNFY
ncbi:phytanoyl-CoA dioxygenase family protein [Novosphingobium sp. PS1R-30]|uniref:Phytanoyl-CoA dioxygenase family protein n=1 Tax=Novosphingobium anseongense TaxID=3133436 RepID=A0ABU8S3G7_9SPHN